MFRDRFCEVYFPDNWFSLLRSPSVILSETVRPLVLSVMVKYSCRSGNQSVSAYDSCDPVTGYTQLVNPHADWPAHRDLQWMSNPLSTSWLTCLFYHLSFWIRILPNPMGGSGSSVGIATELRAERSGSESRWGRDFPPVQTGPGAHPASCKMLSGCVTGAKCGRGVLLTTHPLLVSQPRNSRAIPLPTLWATPGL